MLEIVDKSKTSTGFLFNPLKNSQGKKSKACNRTESADGVKFIPGLSQVLPAIWDIVFCPGFYLVIDRHFNRHCNNKR